jgi:hypothetical protein
VEETHKNMKYIKKPPVIPMIEDDAKIMSDKVKDRGGYVVHIVKV